MDDENRDKLILQLSAEVALLRDVLALLLITHPLPPDALKAYSSIITNPYLSSSPEMLEITDKAVARILSKLPGVPD